MHTPDAQIVESRLTRLRRSAELTSYASPTELARDLGVDVELVRREYRNLRCNRARSNMLTFVEACECFGVALETTPRWTKAAAKARTKPATRTETTARADADEWVYICKDVSGLIMYVGITNSGLARFRGHSKESTWFPDVAQIDVEHLATRDAALAREAELIETLRPLHNRALNPDWIAARAALTPSPIASPEITSGTSCPQDAPTGRKGLTP